MNSKQLLGMLKNIDNRYDKQDSIETVLIESTVVIDQTILKKKKTKLNVYNTRPINTSFFCTSHRNYWPGTMSYSRNFRTTIFLTERY
jgi:hypothetical protein